MKDKTMKITNAFKWMATASVLILAATAGAKDYLVYFGTYTGAQSQGIYVSRLDAKTGTLTDPVLAVATPNPTWVTISPDEKFLYAANGVRSFDGKDGGAVSAFAIDAKTGLLTLVNEKSSGGTGPCYVSVDGSDKMLMIANYNGGNVKSYRLDANGGIGADGTFIQHTGQGVNTNRQTGPHAHFIATDPKNHFALACDLGIDKVVVYALNTQDGTLELKSGFTTTTVPAGSGARHLAFSKDGKFVHVINEMGCTVTTLKWGAKDGSLEPVETVSALPESVPWKDNFTAAEIQVHPSGKFVYATVRGTGSDLVSVFKADTKTGKLSWIQSIGAGGQIPRGLGIDPTGHWLITGNQKGNNAMEYAIDVKTGKLTPTGRELKMGSPVDVTFVTAE
jgi:6-phosphogluconolactonase